MLTTFSHTKVTQKILRHWQPKRIHLLLIVFFGAIGVFLYVERNTNDILQSPWILSTLFGKKNAATAIIPTEDKAILPTPSFLPKGEQTYTISSTDASPKITSLTLNPLDPAMGAKQSITVLPGANQDVQNIFITIYTDTNKYPLTLNPKDGTFTSQWTVKDTISYRYIIKIVAQNSTKSSTTIISPRTNGPIDKSILD